MMWQEDLLRGAAEDFNVGRVDPLLDLFTEDTVLNAAPQVADRSTYHGRTGVREWMEEAAARWSATRLSIGAVEPRGDRVLLELGLIGGAGAWRLFGVLWFRDRMIARADFFADRRDALELFGN